MFQLPVFNPVLNHPIHGDVLGGRVPFQNIGCMLRFTKNSIVQHIMHGIKYENRKNLAVFMGEMFGQKLKEENFTCDYLIPVPIHKQKLKERGYNQAAQIAYGISRQTGIPVLEGILIKSRYTQTQTKMNKEQRMKNLAQSFALSSEKHVLENKHACIVDDVLTTGSTTESIWEVMKEISSIKISAVYLCHARD
jgi:ComF family protein